MTFLQEKRAIGIAFIAAVLIAFVPSFATSYTVSMVMLLLLFYTLAQSWDWVGGELGYVNLSHYASYGIGAYVFAIPYTNGAHFLVALALASLVTSVIIALISIPLFRLQGEYFAFATLALLPLFDILASNLKSLTNGTEGIILPAEQVTGIAFLLMVGLAFLTFVTTTLIVHSPFGLVVRSIRDDEEAAESIGVRVLPRKIMVISAAIAATAGGIHGWYLSFIDPGTMFGLDVALVPIAMALLGGSALLWGPIVGVIVLVFLNQWLLAYFSILHAAFYGLIILLVGRYLPGGLLRSSLVRRIKFVSLLAKEHHERSSVSGNIVEGLDLTPPASGEQDVALECRSVSKNFGGNAALSDVSLTVRRGEIVGLIGANGSGKTTLFNCISRIYDVSSGEVLVDGQPITGLRKDEVAHAGIGRTYQIPRSFERMTVRENVTTALLGRSDPPRFEDALNEAARFVCYVGLGHHLDDSVSTLSAQKRKSLELARALATSPKILLIDEVASGLTPTEIDQFVAHIRELRDRYGLTIIWVEHIFSALAQVVDRVVVLEQGKVIANGTLDVVLTDEAVQRSYFGAKAAETEPC